MLDLLVGALGGLLADPQDEFAESEEHGDHDGRPDDLIAGPSPQEEDDVQQDKKEHSNDQAAGRTLLPSGLVVGGRHGDSLVSEFGQ